VANKIKLWPQIGHKMVEISEKSQGEQQLASSATFIQDEAEFDGEVEATAQARRKAAIKEGKRRAVEPGVPAFMLNDTTRGCSANPPPLPVATPSRPTAVASSTTTIASTTCKRARDSTDDSVVLKDHRPLAGKTPRASLGNTSARMPPAPSSASLAHASALEAAPLQEKVFDKVYQLFLGFFRPKASSEGAQLDK